MFQGNAQADGQSEIDVPAWRKNIRDDIKTNYHYNMALSLRRHGDSASALTHLDYTIDAVPGFIPAYFEKAEILRDSGQIAEAERVENSVKIVVGQNYRASALLHRGRSMITIDAASGLADLATVCTLATGAVAAAAHEAIAMHRLGGALRYRDAGDAVGYASELKAALAEKPDFPPTLFHWAVFCREHQDMAEARRAILLAIDGSPPEDQAVLIDEALLILRSTLDLATALELSRQRRTLKPESDSLVLHESLLLIGLGRSTEAVALLQKEVSRRADEPTLLCYLGTALLAVDDLEQAVQVLSQAVSIAPSSWQAHAELAVAVARLGQQERALQELAKAHGTGPDREWIWTGKGLVLLAAGLPDEAAEAMQRATQIPWPYCDRNALRFMACLRPWARSFMDNVYDKAGVPKPQPNA